MQAEHETRVREVVRDMLVAIDHADSPALEAIWAQDSSMFFPFLNTPRLALGRSGILARFASLFEKFKAGGAAPPYVGFALTDLRVEFIGDAALCTFSYPVAGLLARRTMILVRQDAQWRLKHVHASNANIEDDF